MIAEAEDLFRSDTTDAWIARLRSQGVPCSRYYLPTEAINDPGALANDFVEDLDHPTIGRYRTTTTPMSMDKSPGPNPRSLAGAWTTHLRGSDRTRLRNVRNRATPRCWRRLTHQPPSAATPRAASTATGHGERRKTGAAGRGFSDLGGVIEQTGTNAAGVASENAREFRPRGASALPLQKDPRIQ